MAKKSDNKPKSPYKRRTICARKQKKQICKLKPFMPIFVIPGVMGTYLKTGMTLVWAPDKTLLGATATAQRNLFTNTTKQRDNFKSAQVAKAPNPRGGDYPQWQVDAGWTEVSQKYYRPLLVHLAKDNGCSFKRFDTEVFAIGYEWVRSCLVSCGRVARKIYERMEALSNRKRGKPKKFVMVTHSMGGLIARAMLKRLPDLMYGRYKDLKNQCALAIHVVPPMDGGPVLLARLHTGAIDEGFAFKRMLGNTAPKFRRVVSGAEGVLDLLPNSRYKAPSKPKDGWLTWSCSATRRTYINSWNPFKRGWKLHKLNDRETKALLAALRTRDSSGLMTKLTGHWTWSKVTKPYLKRERLTNITHMYEKPDGKLGCGSSLVRRFDYKSGSYVDVRAKGEAAVEKDLERGAAKAIQFHEDLGSLMWPNFGLVTSTGLATVTMVKVEAHCTADEARNSKAGSGQYDTVWLSTKGAMTGGTFPRRPAGDGTVPISSQLAYRPTGRDKDDKVRQMTNVPHAEVFDNATALKHIRELIHKYANPK